MPLATQRTLLLSRKQDFAKQNAVAAVFRVYLNCLRRVLIGRNCIPETGDSPGTLPMRLGCRVYDFRLFPSRERGSSVKRFHSTRHHYSN